MGRATGAHRLLSAFALFLAAAATVAAAASASLLRPPWLARMWAPKQASYQQLLRLRPWSGGGLALLAVLLVAAAVGWTGRRRWGWWLAVGILAVNLGGDLATAVVGRRWEDALGAGVEGLVLAWVLSPGVRAAFRGRGISRDR